MCDKYQIVILTLDDGTELVYTGKVQIEPENERRAVCRIRFTEPKELPEGFTLGSLEENT